MVRPTNLFTTRHIVANRQRDCCAYSQEDGFREFLQRPENQAIIETHQRKQALRVLKAQDRERAYGFRNKVWQYCLPTQLQDASLSHAPEVRCMVTQVLEAEYDVQKAIAPFLKIPALRTIVQTFTNDLGGDFQKWAGNPCVLEMLTEAKRLLDEGHMTEPELERAFVEGCKVWSQCSVAFTVRV